MNETNETSAGSAQALGEHLQAAIAATHALRKDPGVSKKWLNKIGARLEEVEAFTARLYKPEVASLLEQPAGCTCPPGVRATDCPVHGNSNG